VVALALTSSLAAALDLKLDGPLNDERVVVTGHTGASVFSVLGRGQYVVGKTSAQGDYTQGGGEVAIDFAAIAAPTGLGGMFGLEGEFSLGLMRSEAYANGALRDQRSSSDAGDPAKLWLTTRLGARYVLSPPPLMFGTLGLRLGLVGGLQIEGSGARSWTLAGAFTAGAHLAYGSPSMGAKLAWLAIPPQGTDEVLVRHQFSLDLGVGAFTIGARVQLDHLDVASMRGLPAGTLDSTTFGLALGYRGAGLKL